MLEKTYLLRANLVLRTLSLSLPSLLIPFGHFHFAIKSFPTSGPTEKEFSTINLVLIVLRVNEIIIASLSDARGALWLLLQIGMDSASSAKNK